MIPEVSALLSQVEKARYDKSYLLTWMPKKPKTKAQESLQSLHGTPREFATACLNLVPEISMDEAVAAMLKYKQEWETC